MFASLSAIYLLLRAYATARYADVRMWLFVMAVGAGSSYVAVCGGCTHAAICMWLYAVDVGAGSSYVAVCGGCTI
ncbi:hypothetical protein D3C71_1942830 [compost metagenome]